MPTFIAKRCSQNSNVLYPDKLEIQPGKVELFKGGICGYMRMTIPQTTIARVSINAGMFFADIVIETYGGRTLVAEGFGKKDAKYILSFITPQI